MVRINQKPVAPSPPQSSAAASSARTAATSLRSRLAEEIQQDLPVPVNQEKRASRLVRNWHRLLERMVLVMKAASLKSVDEHWENQALLNDAKELEGTQMAHPTRQQTAQRQSKPRRRDDLTGIGTPIPPTAKKYPYSRATCNHTDPETLEQTLKAAGGAHLVDGVRVPFYSWVCSRCGARWQRIEAGRDLSRHPQDRQPVQVVTVAEPLRAPCPKVGHFPKTSSSSSSRALVPSVGSRPDVPVKSEGRMSQGVGAGYPKPARIQPTSAGAQAQTPTDALPDVMMIHSDLEDEDSPPP